MLARRKFIALIFALPAAISPLNALAAPDPGGKKKGGGLSFIQFETLTATLFHPDGRRGVMTIEAGIDVPDAGLRDRASLNQPRLRAAYVQALQVYANGLSPGATPDADYIARTLQSQTNRVLGQAGARLLLGTVMVN